MASNDRKIIVQIIGTEEEETAGPDEKKVEGSTKNSKKKNSKQEIEFNAKALVKMGTEKVGDTITHTAQVSLNRYFSMSENYMAETDYQNAMTIVNKGKSFYRTISSGALAGNAVGGPMGAAVGAIISAGTWGINEYVNYQQRMSNYYQNLNATRYQTEFDRTRLGLTNEGKGTEN